MYDPTPIACYVRFYFVSRIIFIIKIVIIGIIIIQILRSLFNQFRVTFFGFMSYFITICATKRVRVIIISIIIYGRPSNIIIRIIVKIFVISIGWSIREFLSAICLIIISIEIIYITRNIVISRKTIIISLTIITCIENYYYFYNYFALGTPDYPLNQFLIRLLRTEPTALACSKVAGFLARYYCFNRSY